MSSANDKRFSSKIPTPTVFFHPLNANLDTGVVYIYFTLDQAYTASTSTRAAGVGPKPQLLGGRSLASPCTAFGHLPKVHSCRNKGVMVIITYDKPKPLHLAMFTYQIWCLLSRDGVGQLLCKKPTANKERMRVALEPKRRESLVYGSWC